MQASDPDYMNDDTSLFTDWVTDIMNRGRVEPTYFRFTEVPLDEVQSEIIQPLDQLRRINKVTDLNATGDPSAICKDA